MMDMEEIFSNFEFKLKHFEDYRKAYLFRMKKFFFKIVNKEKLFLFNNVIIKNNEDFELKKILLKIEGMSTYAIGYIINQICKRLTSNQVYLNIGCWKGFSLVSGMINTKCLVYGVDNFSEFGYVESEFYKNFNMYKKNKFHFFFNQDYKIFLKKFEIRKKYIDFYFYDAEHSYKDQIENLELVDNLLKKGSIIMIDDINFREVFSATNDFLAKNNKRYRVLKKFQTANNHCHPSFWNGLMLLEKYN